MAEKTLAPEECDRRLDESLDRYIARLEQLDPDCYPKYSRLLLYVLIRAAQYEKRELGPAKPVKRAEALPRRKVLSS